MLLNSGKVPKKDLLIGVNNDEGTYLSFYGLPGFNITGESLITRAEFLSGVPLALPNEDDVAREAAIFYYTDWADESNGTRNRDLICSLAGDKHFYCPVLDFAHR